jgi:hypothetical protein
MSGCCFCGWSYPYTLEPCNQWWCQQQAEQCPPEEWAVLVSLKSHRPTFRLWRDGARAETGEEDTPMAACQDHSLPDQPAEIGRRTHPNVRGLYVGDLDDAMNISQLTVLGIRWQP